MNQQEELKRKIAGLTNFKTVSTLSNIPVAKDWKRADISRQKQDKPILDRQSKLITLDQNTKHPNPKALNFRNLKQTLPKKDPKNPMLFTKPVSEYYPKSTRHQEHGISINVNIQNMLKGDRDRGDRGEGEGVSQRDRGDRGVQEKKSRRVGGNGNLAVINPNSNHTHNGVNNHSANIGNISNNFGSNISNMSNVGNISNMGNMGNVGNISNINNINNMGTNNNMNLNVGKFDEFECTEELVFKRTPIEKKAKLGDKTVEKVPLIDRKLIKTDFQVKPKQKQLQLDTKDILKKFQLQMDAINSTAEAQTINYLDWRQQFYLIPPNYMDRSQKNFSWKMRATLLEWMMHVCYEFAMKRETFYISINLVDLYLSKEYHLPKSEFQLAGAAAMFIASKIEEFQPKSSEEFAVATKTYKGSEVKQMQKKICKTLKYNLNPPTLSTWANRFMLQWDTYLQLNPYGRNHNMFMHYPHKFFKKWDDESYKLYRSVMQLLDFASLDIQSVQYQPKLLVCAFMYLILGKEMGFFKLKDVVNDFPRSSLYLLDDNEFNDLFMNFLQTSFNIMLIDLLPTVQYCATYFILHMNYEDPMISANDDELSNVEFEDFCSYQTYNPNMKLAISKRFRGIYE